MTIQGAVYELEQMLSRTDIPDYFKLIIKKVIETIVDKFSEQQVYEDESSVTPQPKIGRWIDDKCSVCGKGIEDLIDSREWYENEEPNFCPFCGLKMVNSQESEVKKC